MNQQNPTQQQIQQVQQQQPHGWNPNQQQPMQPQGMHNPYAQQQQGYNPHAVFQQAGSGSAGQPQSYQSQANQQSDYSNAWGDFGSVDGDSNDPFFEEGNHLCQVVELATFGGTPDDPRVFFKARFRVVESNTVPSESRRATMSTIAGDKKRTLEIGRRVTKALVMAILGQSDAAQIDGSTMTRLCSDEQPARGLFVRNVATKREKKQAPGQFYVRDNWQPVPMDQQQQLVQKYGLPKVEG